LQKKIIIIRLEINIIN